MRYQFHPAALAEYEEATRYYAEGDSRVAERFIAAVERMKSGQLVQIA